MHSTLLTNAHPFYIVQPPLLHYKSSAILLFHALIEEHHYSFKYKHPYIPDIRLTMSLLVIPCGGYHSPRA